MKARNLLPLLAAGMLAASLSAQTQVIVQGDQGQTPGDAADIATPSAALTAQVGNTWNYDEAAGPPFGTTITVPADADAATLHLRLTPVNTMGLISQLNLVANGPGFNYHAPFSFLHETINDQSLIIGQSIDLYMDLAALPDPRLPGGRFSLMGAVQQGEDLDIFIPFGINVDLARVIYTQADTHRLAFDGAYPNWTILQVSGATPFAQVQINAGYSLGWSNVSGVDLGIVAIAPGPTVTADANGMATLAVLLPSITITSEFYFQSIDLTALEAGTILAP